MKKEKMKKEKNAKIKGYKIPAWLKGGVVGVIILLLLLLPLPTPCTDSEICNIFWFILGAIYTLLGIPLVLLVMATPSFYLLFILAFIVYFAIGAVIGKIIARIWNYFFSKKIYK